MIYFTANGKQALVTENDLTAYLNRAVDDGRDCGEVGRFAEAVTIASHYFCDTCGELHPRRDLYDLVRHRLWTIYDDDTAGLEAALSYAETHETDPLMLAVLMSSSDLELIGLAELHRKPSQLPTRTPHSIRMVSGAIGGQNFG